MQIRTAKERIFQTLGYEVGALLLMVPAYHLLTGANIADSLLLLVLLSVVVVIVTPVHNIIFDYIEAKKTRKLASERTPKWRVVHAISHEFWLVLVTLPIIIFVENYTFREALFIDIVLTLAYMIYAYFYYWLFDKLVPMKRQSVSE